MYRPIPELDSKGDVYKTLGPTDPAIYHKSLGKLTTALVFIDFPEIKGNENTAELAQELTSNGRAEKWYESQSFGKMSMEFICPSNEWRTMSKSPDKYDSKTTASHREYIAEALNLFPEIDFTKYHFVIVIPSNKKRQGVGTACFSESKGQGAKTKHGRINLAATFGTSNFTPLTYYTVIHELGHAMSLPDTYDVNVRGLKHRAVAGAWDLMCDVGNGVNFLGWHRHKLEWLDDSRKHYMSEEVFETTLSSLSSSNGLAMVAIPVGNSAKPSKVFVVELALPIRQSGKELDMNNTYGSGVLIYSVDATVVTGNRPLVVYPKSTDYSKIYSYTYKAPFLEGDTFEHKNAPMKVEVFKKEGENYKVRIIRNKMDQ